MRVTHKYTKEQVKEYLDKIDLNKSDSPTGGFLIEEDDLFDSIVVSKEEDYYKHKSRLVSYTHKIVDTDIYFQISGMVDYDYGLELDNWYFVEPVTKTTTEYRIVKEDNGTS